ncbi:MAG: hypothetical protein EOP48_21610, partial [Sphingobacteriales bacterium]
QLSYIFITQNINSYHAVLTGDKSTYRVKSFLGTMATKIFHANSDIETNKYASDLVGQDYFEDQNESTSFSEKFSHTQGKSYKLQPILRPEHFMKLKTGGKVCDYIVEGVIHRQGSPIYENDNHVEVSFFQKVNPLIK